MTEMFAHVPTVCTGFFFPRPHKSLGMRLVTAMLLWIIYRKGAEYAYVLASLLTIFNMTCSQPVTDQQPAILSKIIPTLVQRL